MRAVGAVRDAREWVRQVFEFLGLTRVGRIATVTVAVVGAFVVAVDFVDPGPGAEPEAVAGLAAVVFGLLLFLVVLADTAYRAFRDRNAPRRWQ